MLFNKRWCKILCQGFNHLKYVFIVFIEDHRKEYILETLAKAALLNSLWIIKDGGKGLECLSPMHVKYL